MPGWGGRGRADQHRCAKAYYAQLCKRIGVRVNSESESQHPGCHGYSTDYRMLEAFAASVLPCGKSGLQRACYTWCPGHREHHCCGPDAAAALRAGHPPALSLHEDVPSLILPGTARQAGTSLTGPRLGALLSSGMGALILRSAAIPFRTCCPSTRTRGGLNQKSCGRRVCHAGGIFAGRCRCRCPCLQKALERTGARKMAASLQLLVQT